jgi:hypothetical protein
MKSSLAKLLLLVFCIALAALVLFKVIKFIAVVLLFAAALVMLGLLSKGFHKKE